MGPVPSAAARRDERRVRQADVAHRRVARRGGCVLGDDLEGVRLGISARFGEERCQGEGKPPNPGGATTALADLAGPTDNRRTEAECSVVKAEAFLVSLASPSLAVKGGGPGCQSNCDDELDASGNSASRPMSRKKKRVRCGFRKSNNSQIADFRWTGDGVVMRRRMCTARVGASRGTTGRSVWSTIDVAELRHMACACYGVSRSRGTDSFVYGNLDELSSLLAPCSDRFPPSAAVPPDGKPTPAQAASRSPSANLAGRGEALAVNPRMHVAFHSKRFVPTLVNMAQPAQPRCCCHRRTWVTVSRCMNAASSASLAGQTRRCQWLGISA